LEKRKNGERSAPGWLFQSILGNVRLSQDRPRACKGIRRGLIFAFDATIWLHENVINLVKRDSRSRSPTLEQF
jgi:hypothetical protein